MEEKMKMWTLDEMLAEYPCARYTADDNALLRKIWGEREALAQKIGG